MDPVIFIASRNRYRYRLASPDISCAFSLAREHGLLSPSRIIFGLTLLGHPDAATHSVRPLSFDSRDNFDGVITFPRSSGVHCWAVFVRDSDITRADSEENPGTALSQELTKTYILGVASAYEPTGRSWWLCYNPIEDETLPRQHSAVPVSLSQWSVPAPPLGQRRYELGPLFIYCLVPFSLLPPQALMVVH